MRFPQPHIVYHDTIPGDDHLPSVTTVRCRCACGQETDIVAPTASFEAWLAGAKLTTTFPQLTQGDRICLECGQCGVCIMAEMELTDDGL